MRTLRQRWDRLSLDFGLFLAALTFALCGLASAAAAQSPVADPLAELHQQFAHPPDSSRILMRWWWFGPAVSRDEITRELEQMKAAGIGGVEVAHLYALALDEPAAGFHNATFLSDEHLAALSFAASEARRLGLRVDVTLGSGWPLGGPAIPVNEAAGKLRVESAAVAPGATSAEAPFTDTGEEWIAAFLLEDGAPPETASALPPPDAGRYAFVASVLPRSIVTFLSSRTGMTVKRPAVGAEGFVLDHYDPAAIATHLRAVGDRLLSAFGDQPPYAVFSDSLEDYASDWTPRLLDEFQRRRGYDLRPHLLALVMDVGPQSAAIRHDWGRTLTELADDNFLKPMEAWAKRHGTQLRSQTYGFPPVTLSSNRWADLPEGEGKATFEMWREFSDTRWAASAGHLFHRPVISSETWTWLHSPAFRATPLDMKAEADLHFLQGINQLVGHGWPFSPAMAGEPGWRMYAAAALNDHNPWFMAMPDLAAYLQRVSFALREGEPANDIALLLPNDDVWAGFRATVQNRATPISAAGFDESGSNITIDESMGKVLGKRVIAQVLDAGFNLDFIDADAIDSVGIPYRALVLPAVDRLPVATYEKVLAFARQGGLVVAYGRTPAAAPGLLHAEQDSARLREISRELFHGGLANTHLLADESPLGKTLAAALPPDMTLDPPNPQIGFIHRKLPAGDLYFVANTGNQTVRTKVRFRDAARRAELWDPFTGNVEGLSDPASIRLNLEPYGSRLVFFSDGALPAAAEPPRRETATVDLSRDWTVSFGEHGPVLAMERLVSWTEDPRTAFYSGDAVYRKTFNLPDASAAKPLSYILDFGTATPLPLPDPPGENNMRAYLDPPVREAAEIWVNGQHAGVVWRPPYRLEITPLLHPGENEVRIVVGNTAINELAGRALPDYRLLRDRYGMLFVPQDMRDLKPLPSGLLGPVTLIGSAPAR